MATNQPKTMSSRLLTMKFMQRSAAKAVTSPSTPTGPPSKRMRTSIGGASTPGTPSDYEVIQAALAAEEKKREEALEKQAAAAGETKWYFSIQEPAKMPQMKIVQAGWGAIDALEDDDSEDDNKPVGRMTFGKFTKATSTPAKEGDSDSDSDLSDDEDEDDDPTSILIREEARKAKRKAARQELKSPMSKQWQEDLDDNMDHITSISGSGGGGAGGGGAFSGSCYMCGKKGHMSGDCPRPPQGSRGGRPRGGRKSGGGFGGGFSSGGFGGGGGGGSTRDNRRRH